MKKLCLILITALTLSACDRTTQTAANFNAVTNSTGTPTMFIAAPPSKVEQVIISRAAAKGSAIKPSNNGKLVLERSLTQPSAEVIAACGESWFGRKVRVVMSLQPVNGGTQIAENRYIVGITPVGGDCKMPLSAEDYAQSMGAMSEVKAQAER